MLGSKELRKQAEEERTLNEDRRWGLWEWKRALRVREKGEGG